MSKPEILLHEWHYGERGTCDPGRSTIKYWHEWTFQLSAT